jgi:hypothetical protein
MNRRFVWVMASNLDAILGVALALTVSVLGLADLVDQDLVNNAILLVLALLAQAVLRERWRRDDNDEQMKALLQRTTTLLADVPQRLDRLTEVEEVIGQARYAFDAVSIVKVLHGGEVAQALAEARHNTSRWHFKGGTGTFIRAVTLPRCVEDARRRNGTLDFQIEIIDPTDEDVCLRYSTFRRSLDHNRDLSGELWTTDRTRKESFATILAACWHQQRSSLLKIGVYLSAHLTTFRYDLSSTGIIITQEDPRTPAMQISSEQIYYNRYDMELQFSREQSRAVPLSEARSVTLDEEPTVEQTRRLFTALNLALPRSFGDREVTDIVRKAIQPQNFYQ